MRDCIIAQQFFIYSCVSMLNFVICFRELSFRKGDLLYIRRKVDQNWYEGEHNAAVGIFPGSYVSFEFYLQLINNINNFSKHIVSHSSKLLSCAPLRLGG